VTHIGHFKLSNETGASKVMISLAVLTSSVAMILALIYISRESEHIISILIGFVFIAVITETTLQKINKREIKPRIQNV
jgi:hypothetical protein